MSAATAAPTTTLASASADRRRVARPQNPTRRADDRELWPREPDLYRRTAASSRSRNPGYLVAAGRSASARIDQADATIEELTERIAVLLDPHEAAVSLLVGIAGVGRRIAEVILAEIGTDMSRFPTAGHLASWAGMCPGNNESAGKRGSGRTRHGSKWLRIALVEAGHAAGRSEEPRPQTADRQFGSKLRGDEGVEDTTQDTPVT